MNKYKKYNQKNNNLYKKKNIHKKQTVLDLKKKNYQNNYLYKNKKINKGIFLKNPKFNEVMYPFYLNIKLINEYLKKK